MQILFRKNKIWIRMIKMSEKCVITIEDVLYQAKRKNRDIDTYKIKKHIHMLKINIKINIENLASHILFIHCM